MVDWLRIYVTAGNSCLFIFLSFIACMIYVLYQQGRKNISAKKRTIEQFPNLLSTLGVLGTFLGITIGLIGFDPADLDNSIPILLDGLKTAFWTSLTGMLCSIFSNWYINGMYDKDEAGKPTDNDEAAILICEAVTKMSKENVEIIQELKNAISMQRNEQNKFYEFVYSQQSEFHLIKDELVKVNGAISPLHSDFKSMNDSVNSFAKMIQVELQNVNSYQISVMDSLHKIEGYSEKQGILIKSGVEDIGNRMGKTEDMLQSKFTEFSELLKKSNTEALVEVMKTVTMEFQTQMSTLINKLVQENFEQLNNSVSALNIWQQENKQMIMDLTLKYSQMAESFNNTTSVFSDVARYVETLSGAEGLLSKLIQELQKVMIDDTRFTEITTKLSETVSLTQDSIVKFNDSTSSLNDWVRKQRKFVDGVQLLISKLEELSSIRDYNKEFWQDTKKSLEEGVGIIKSGTTQLNSQLKELDKQFYARLSATLAELDTCIQAMIKVKK